MIRPVTCGATAAGAGNDETHSGDDQASHLQHVYTWGHHVAQQQWQKKEIDREW
jgi:hypothetical protein